MDEFVIDVFEFCRLKDARSGDTAIIDLPRLAAETPERSAILRWSVTGGMHKLGYPQLMLSVSGVVALICQRCLMPFPFSIDARSFLVLAKDEESADELDALLEDEAIDVIAATKTMNLLALIEDEALLALPLSPKHEICPDSASQDAIADQKESPFAMLKDFKQ